MVNSQQSTIIATYTAMSLKQVSIWYIHICGVMSCLYHQSYHLWYRHHQIIHSSDLWQSTWYTYENYCMLHVHSQKYQVWCWFGLYFPYWYRILEQWQKSAQYITWCWNHAVLQNDIDTEWFFTDHCPNTSSSFSICLEPHWLDLSTWGQF